MNSTDTLRSLLSASRSFFNLKSPSQGFRAEGGATQAHLQSGPEVMVSTV